MDSKVHTTKGMIDRELLTQTDTVSWAPNARIIRTEWFLNGEFVRSDVWVSVLDGIALNSEAEKLGAG